MREFIRHPVGIPIEIAPGDSSARQLDQLTNLSFGGIAFRSLEAFSGGQIVDINITCVQPTFNASGLVKWCHPDGDGFEVGVEFIDPNDKFRARMVEQVCYIEQYKNDVIENEGRQITGEQAAIEWIAQFAAVFPGQDNDK